MDKRIKAEAKSIVGNCNLKILGRIEDPTETKEFVTRHGGMAYVMETKGFTAPTNTVGSMFANMPFHDDRGAAIQVRQRIDYDHLRGQREGEAHLIFGDWACKAQMFFVAPEKAKALRVNRFLPVPGVTKSSEARDRVILELASRLKDKEWTAAGAGGAAKDVPEIAAMAKTVAAAEKARMLDVEMGAVAVASMDKLPPVAKSAVPATSNGKNGQTTVAYGQDSKAPKGGYANGTSAATRTGLPPLYDGDEFAIEDIVQAPAATYTAQKSAAPFAGTHADLSAIVPSLGDDETEDFSSVVLPDTIISFLAQSAQQMNEGLRGKNAQK
jgi:hypothetical protein